MEPTYRSDDPRLEACALHEFSDAELREKLEYEKKRPQPNKARILAVEREMTRREASPQVHGDGQASAPPEPPQEPEADPEADPDSAPWDLVERVAKAERERDKLQSALGDMQLDLHQARREKKEAERQAEESLRRGGTEPEPEPNVVESGDGPDVQPLLGTEEPDPMEWRVADFVPEDHLTMLVGDGGTGKSVLALHLALCICTGRSFLGMGTKRGRVLYIDHELDREEQLRRVHRIARAMGIDASDSSLRDRFRYWRPTHPLGSEEHQADLMQAVTAHKIDLVILDSLTMGAEGDVTDVADVVPIMQHLRQWPTTVAIDHVSHSTARGSAAQARAFGSVFKRNAARSSLTLAKSDTGGYCIQQEKSNFSEGDGRLTYAVEWGEEEITFEAISDADARAQGLLSDLSSKDVTLVAVKEEYEALGGAVLAENVVDWREGRDDVTSVAKKTVQNHFSALKQSGDLIGAKGEGVKPKAAEHDPAQEAPF